MSHPTDEDQPLNFGSDLSIKACIGNCLEGECCDCDYHQQEPSDSRGQPAPTPYQQLLARDSLLSVASSGQGPSQPRPITQQQYYATQPMNYGSASYAGRGNTATHGDHPASYAGHPSSYADFPVEQGGYSADYGGVHIAAQFPAGFTTQASSYQEGREPWEVIPFQASMGWYRDGSNRLCNGRGEHITDQGEVIQSTASNMPQSSATSDSFDNESFRTAPSHHSGSNGGGSRSSSKHSHQHGKKFKDH